MLLGSQDTFELGHQFTQPELMKRFNLAFFEAQNASKTSVIHHEPDVDDYFIDYLISNRERSSSATPCTPADDFFDFNDFVQTFDQNISASVSTSSGSDACTSTSDCGTMEDWDYCKFLVPSPPLHTLSDVEFSDIDLCETLSNESIDLDFLATDLQDLDDSLCKKKALPSITTIGGGTVNFSNFLRNTAENDLSYGSQEASCANFGHLIATTSPECGYPSENIVPYQISDNQMVVTQHEALLNDDPLLGASNLVYPKRQHLSSESDSSNDCEEISSFGTLQCLWEECYQIYESQSSLVKHIEKCHVEVKRGDEFTCFWANCPRQVKPFNARYKLLIHMRVHSGEKPNKCPFKGCNKAFSRLENLKIHQRSHTGERPYLCQFSACTKSFSNSSDRAKHQRTHFDTKPYGCQVMGCNKKYTDPSSLRKHVKNHTTEEQMMLKKKTGDDNKMLSPSYTRRFLDPNRQKAAKPDGIYYYTNLDHNYSNTVVERKYNSSNIRQDLKNKISEKNKLKNVVD